MVRVAMVSVAIDMHGRPRLLGALPRLQPYAAEAATLCCRGCNPMLPRLQPYASSLSPRAAVRACMASVL